MMKEGQGWGSSCSRCVWFQMSVYFFVKMRLMFDKKTVGTSCSNAPVWLANAAPCAAGWRLTVVVE